MKIGSVRNLVTCAAAGLSLAAVARPVIDGKIGADEWKGVKWHHGMQALALNKALTKDVKDVDFGFLSDEKNVYFVARCHESDVARLKARKMSSIWGSDSIELFLCPDGSSFEFYHFVFSPTGDRVYTEFRSEGGNITPVPFHPVWERAGGYEEKAWVFEAAIPLTAFSMTRNLNWTDKWRFNIVRTVTFPKYSNTTYAPLFESFMESEKYPVEGGFPMRAAGDDLAVFAATARLDARGGKGFVGTYSVDVLVPTAGAYELNGVRFDLPAGASKVTIPCDCEREGRVMTRFTLRNVKDGNVYAHDYPVWIEFCPVRVKLTTPAYRNNFYPGQDASRVAGTVEVMSGKDAVLTLEGPGFPKRTVTVKGGKGEFAFDTKGFTVGDAKLTAVAEGAEPVEVKVRNLPPTGHNMVWIENGHLVANGKPIYRRNLYGPRYRTGYKLNELITTEWASQAFTPEMEERVSMDPQDYIRGIEQKEGTQDVYPSKEILDKLAAKIDSLKDKDFGYYYLNDEPECRNVSAVWLKHLYNFIAERDPYHPITGASRGGASHVDCFDVIETHPYICPRNEEGGKRSYTRHPRTIPQFIRRFGCEGRPDKVVGHIPMLFAYRYQSFACDYPNFREYVGAGWIAAIAGSMTIWPYCGHDWYDRASLWHGNRYLFQSFAALETPLVLGKRTLVVDTPDAIAAVWEQANGDTMLAFVNLGDKPLDMDAALKDVAQLKGLTLFEHRGERVYRPGEKIELGFLETFVASVQRHDVGLETYKAVSARIDAEEKERLSRDNQLLEQYMNVRFDGEICKGREYKLIDGALWQQAVPRVDWKVRPSLEVICENGFKPTFDRVVIHGTFDPEVGTPWVETWTKDGWLKYGTRSATFERFRREIVLDQRVTSDRFRVVFPGVDHARNDIELYEIEIPKAK